MGSALKDIYSLSFYNTFSDTAEKIIPSFNRKKFIKTIFNSDWENKELKERMKHTTFVLHQFMPEDFVQAAGLIEEITITLQQTKINENLFGFMFLPDYIETHGINHFEVSVKAMETVTQFISCEYAVRPFIIKYYDRMMKQMLEWSKHKNHHVRRFASEGARPRLPWAMAVPQLKKDPKHVLPILETLKQDASEYVRRSVANNLNDIAKDHPAIVIAIANKWKGLGKETDALIKHGCRTLLKKGNAEILKHFGLSNNAKLEVSNLKIITPKVKIGNALIFSFEAQNKSGKDEVLRLEYAIYYLLQNGQHSKKVFKISERIFQPKEKTEITRKQSFRIITTKKFYTGQHKLSVIINGQEKLFDNFELMDEKRVK